MGFQSAAESTDHWQQQGELIARHLAAWSGWLASCPEAPDRIALLYRMRACVDTRDDLALDPFMRQYALANLTSGDT